MVFALKKKLSILLIFSLVCSQAFASSCEISIESHRGVGTENSISGIENALAAGFDGVEVDVRTLGDGTWVLHHDETPGDVTETDLREKRIHRMSRDDWDYVYFKGTKTRPPFLTEAVQAFSRSASPNQYLNLEIKGKPSCPMIGNLVGEAKKYLSTNQIRISSMQKRSLRCARSLDSQLYLALVAMPHKFHLQQDDRYRISNRVYKFFTPADMDAHVDDFAAMGGDDYSTRNLIEWSAKNLAPRSGLHLDARSLLDYGYAYEVAAREGLEALVAYSLDSPSQQVSQYQEMSERKILPDAVITDANIQNLCD
jgi:glycerophosphoryl diester phosphodiesterase